MYSADLDSVLSMLKKQAALDENLRLSNFEFYFACLDRIDILITEQHSAVTREEIIAILATLSYFRPKHQEYQHKSDKRAGYFT